MVASTDATNSLAFDTNQLARLKNEAKQNSPEALRETARQFEALFLNMMLKSMREATPQEGAFDSEQTRTYTSMLDQQLSQHLANTKGIGLADVLVKQLSKSLPAAPETVQGGTQRPSSQLFNQTFPYQPIQQLKEVVDETASSKAPTQGLDESINALQDFISPNSRLDRPVSIDWEALNLPKPIKVFGQRMIEAAREASADSGIPTAYLLGQAALESGWGKSEIRNADGSPSYNLFGIKATGNWSGKVTEALTTEYVNGVKQQRVEKFRAYDSYADSFKDFAHLITTNPRYQSALAHTEDSVAYSQALQKGGYATDPHYARKLSQVISLAEQIVPTSE